MKTLTAARLKELLQRREDVRVVDVLPERSHREKHIPGSVNVPVGEDDFLDRIGRIADDKETPVVVYCASRECDLSPKAARKLESAGYTEVFDFEGGVEEWERAGLPLEGSAVGTT